MGAYMRPAKESVWTMSAYVRLVRVTNRDDGRIYAFFNFFGLPCNSITCNFM
ncbi:hypothetical protein K0M31_016738 [Melipona bicolor]|uniref:Uncharacterized protein n=1 Tax=Melipona bicolor TaxID=60889 RepID=A0AA40KEM5_9HYME|nr:hypothetical protein K0M31_016738 [Melipona bicolor]